MDLKTLQSKQAEIQKLIEKKRGIDKVEGKELGLMLRCLKAQEELGELAEAVMLTVAGSRKGKFSISEMKERIAGEAVDVITLMLDVANTLNVDIQEEMDKKLGIDRKRYE